MLGHTAIQIASIGEIAGEIPLVLEILDVGGAASAALNVVGESGQRIEAANGLQSVAETFVEHRSVCIHAVGLPEHRARCIEILDAIY